MKALLHGIKAHWRQVGLAIVIFLAGFLVSEPLRNVYGPGQRRIENWMPGPLPVLSLKPDKNPVRVGDSVRVSILPTESGKALSAGIFHPSCGAESQMESA